MADYQGFRVDVPTLKGIADNSMRPIATDLHNQSQAMAQLDVSGDSGFGTVVPGAKSLGDQYNGVVEAISMLAAAFAGSVGAGADSLDTIADNYHRTDHSIAGH